MAHPMISCIMPTYGKLPDKMHLLEEAVHSFLLQDYPNKELLILNDCPGQEIVCNESNVTVFNHDARMDSVGRKRAFLVEMAQGELIAPWDDDDISLPHRLTLSFNRLGDYDYFNPRSYWFLNAGYLQYEQRTGYAHNCSLFRVSAYHKSGGYPFNNVDDADMDRKLRLCSNIIEGPLSPEDGIYIYRWGIAEHISGNPDVDAGYRRLGERKWQKGTFTLKPRWLNNYSEMVTIKAATMREGGGYRSWSGPTG